MQQEKVMISYYGYQFKYPASWTVLRVAEVTVDGVKGGYENVRRREGHL